LQEALNYHEGFLVVYSVGIN